MGGARQTADSARAEVSDALVGGRRRAGGDRPRTVVGPRAFLALQRQAGNAAVSALVAAKLKSPGEQAVTDIDAALKEVRRDEPAIDTVEKGLKAAKAAGVPVDLEGPKPPPSALAVTKTGFGPESVAPKKPVPPTKPVPATSPLGKAAAGAAKGGGRGKGSAPGKTPAAPPVAGGVAAMGPAPLTADKLLQPPVTPAVVRPEDDPAFTQVTGTVKSFAKPGSTAQLVFERAERIRDASLRLGA